MVSDIEFSKRLERLKKLSSRELAAGLLAFRHELGEVQAESRGNAEALRRLDVQLLEVDSLLADVDTDQP